MLDLPKDSLLKKDEVFLSIVIPAFNEERGISEVVERTLRVKENLLNAKKIKNVEVIVVNDGSRDRTGEILSKFKEVRQVIHEKNKGYGAALKTGFKESRGNVIIFFDADGTYPPEFITDLIDTFEKSKPDLLIGSRLKTGRNQMPLLRYIGNRFYAILLSGLSRVKVSDTASGMRLFQKDVLKKILPLPDGLNFTPAMSTKAIFEGLKVMEIPMPYEERLGRSKLNVMIDGVKFLWTILRISFEYSPGRVILILSIPILIILFILLIPTFLPS